MARQNRNREQSPYKVTPSVDPFKLQVFRAELRKEKSRLAAQIRRNREGQNLMLLQNALPLSTEVLGLNGITSGSADGPSTNLLSMFADEPDLEKWIFSECIRPDDASMLSSLGLLGPSSNSSWAVNLEKADLIRIAGHTLFFLNRIGPRLGVTCDAPSLSLRSHSLYTLMVDPLDDNRIVYASPSLAEVAGIDWVTLLGAPISNLVRSVIPTPRVHRAASPIVSGSKRKSNLSMVRRSDDILFSRANHRSRIDIQLNEFVCLNSPTPSPKQSWNCLVDDINKDVCVRSRKRSRVESVFSPDLDYTAVGSAKDKTKFYCWASMVLHPLTEHPPSNSGSLLGTSTAALESEFPGTKLAPITWLLLRPVSITYPISKTQTDDLSFLFVSDAPVSAGPSRDQKRSKHTRKQTSKSSNRKNKRMKQDSKSFESVEDVTLELVSDILNPLSVAPHEDMELGSDGCSSSALSCSTRLDSLLAVLDTNGNVSECFGLEAEFTLIGQSFLSFVHLDDLETIGNLFSQVLTEKNMCLTPLYRVSMKKGSTPVRRYRWFRSFICCTECPGELECWHQRIGCESSSLTLRANPDYRITTTSPAVSPHMLPTQSHPSVSAESLTPLPCPLTPLRTNVPSSVLQISPLPPSKDRCMDHRAKPKFHEFVLNSNSNLLPDQFTYLPHGTRHVKLSAVTWYPNAVKKSSLAPRHQRFIELDCKAPHRKRGLIYSLRGCKHLTKNEKQDVCSTETSVTAAQDDHLSSWTLDAALSSSSSRGSSTSNCPSPGESSEGSRIPILLTSPTMDELAHAGFESLVTNGFSGGSSPERNLFPYLLNGGSDNTNGWSSDIRIPIVESR